MRTFGRSILILLFLSAVQPVAWAQGKFDLKYEEAQGDLHVLARASGSSGYTILNRPSQIRTIPKDLSGKASYLVMPICGKGVVFALDAGSEKPRLYVDADFDGDVSEEKPIEGVSKRGEIRFDNVPIPVSSDGRKTEVKVTITGWLWGNGQASLNFYPRGVRTGEIELKGESYKLALTDKNLNGRYDSLLKAGSANLISDCDYVAIDLNRNGKFDAESSALEILPLSSIVQVGDSHYSIRPAADGSVVDIRRITPKLGTLDVGSPDVELGLISEAGSYNLSGSDGRWQLPAGSYTTRMLQLKKTDKVGRTWILTCYGGTAGELNRFTIREGETRQMEAGPPLTIRTAASPEGGDVSIGFSILGRAGEQYRPDVRKDGERQPAPKLRIVDKSGKELVKDSFQYG
jgi:hypothetical protein